MIDAHQHQSPPRLAGVPADLADLVAWTPAKRPEDRPDTPAVVAEALPAGEPLLLRADAALKTNGFRVALNTPPPP